MHQEAPDQPQEFQTHGKVMSQTTDQTMHTQELRTEGNYFVAAYPPFSCWNPERVSEIDSLFLRARKSDEWFGLYVHVPFCTTRCSFCYYLSYANRLEQVDDYVSALIKELGGYNQLGRLSERTLDYVYFGGGTPSVLSVSQMARLLEGLQGLIEWHNAGEITFECAPKTITKAKLRLLRDAGVTRVSLGIQQLNNEVLMKNGRVHLVPDVHRAYDEIRDIGFGQINVDLMVGLVGETDDSFLSSLEHVIEMDPDSVSIYQLEMPLNTPLYRSFHDGKLKQPLASWETKRKRLDMGFSKLEAAGYQLRSAYTAVRNQNHRPFLYQDTQYHGADLLGLGVSSFSYYAGGHWQNRTSLEEYFRDVRQNRLPVQRAYLLNAEERMTREFVLQLKLGIASVNYFKQKFQMDVLQSFATILASLEEQGLVRINDQQVAVTRAGMLQVDHLLTAFYLPQHRNRRYA